MIFVTIGTVFPFDRLIRAMDLWAEATGRGDEVLAQIGDGRYRPAHIEWKPSLPLERYASAVSEASVIVSHAGMGSAITAMQIGTPIVLLPRRVEAGEHTTDHQVATARWLDGKPGIFVAWDETELQARIAEAEAARETGAVLGPHAPAAFTDRIRAQIATWLDA